MLLKQDKGVRLMKKMVLTINALMFANLSIAAVNPGTTISRANCWAPFPKTQLTPTGPGWYNESFTYDRQGFALFMANASESKLKPYYHTAYVVSDQKTSGSNQVTRLKSGNSYITSVRIYAGRAQPALLPYPQTGPYYSVTSTHWEKLNSGSTVQFSTSAKECFDNAYL
mgnify:FL=1